MSIETPRNGEMPQTHTDEITSKLNDCAQFRQELCGSFSERPCAMMNPVVKKVQKKMSEKQVR